MAVLKDKDLRNLLKKDANASYLLNEFDKICQDPEVKANYIELVSILGATTDTYTYADNPANGGKGPVEDIPDLAKINIMKQIFFFIIVYYNFYKKYKDKVINTFMLEGFEIWGDAVTLKYGSDEKWLDVELIPEYCRFVDKSENSLDKCCTATYRIIAKDKLSENFYDNCVLSGLLKDVTHILEDYQ